MHVILNLCMTSGSFLYYINDYIFSILQKKKKNVHYLQKHDNQVVIYHKMHKTN